MFFMKSDNYSLHHKGLGDSLVRCHLGLSRIRLLICSILSAVMGSGLLRALAMTGGREFFLGYPGGVCTVSFFVTVQSPAHGKRCGPIFS